MSDIFKGAAKRLEDIDLPRIGAEIGVGEDVLHALIDVETSGSGFDSQGRVKMLFEPHKFYRHLSGKKREQAVKEGLAYPNWGQKPYPNDSYPRLLKATNIDTDAALKSASWGLGQIMGENHLDAGYASVQAMISAFAEDEDNHLEAMVQYIKSAGVDDDLRRIEAISKTRTPTASDWVSVVRTYNGPGYAKNYYDSKAARAFAKWQKIKDTPYDPNTTQPLPVTVVTQTESGKSETKPVTNEVVVPPAIAADSGSKKSFWAVVLGLPSLALTYITQNVGEAFGWLKDKELLKWVLIVGGAILAIYLLRQIVMSVVRQVSAAVFTLQSMKYHADPASNNVVVGQPAPPKPAEES